MKHAELVEIAAKWLKSYGCYVVLKELVTWARETPDAIGWNSDLSILIECKTSRSDFFRDSEKHFREHPEKGMGIVRFYMCKEGLIKPDEVPEKWGLLWVTKKGKVKRAKCFKGKNVGMGYRHTEFNYNDEITMLCSCIRRMIERSSGA